MSTQSAKSMSARASGSVSVPRPSSERSPELVANLADPETAVDRVLALLDADRFQTARKLASRALARFPEHRRVRNAWAIFDPRGKAKVGDGGPEPSTEEEFAWLRNPPAWALGKWVALVGSQAVAVGDTLAEVQKSLDVGSFAKRPLVHHIGAA